VIGQSKRPITKLYFELWVPPQLISVIQLTVIYLNSEHHLPDTSSITTTTYWFKRDLRQLYFLICRAFWEISECIWSVSYTHNNLRKGVFYLWKAQTMQWACTSGTPNYAREIPKTCMCMKIYYLFYNFPMYKQEGLCVQAHPHCLLQRGKPQWGGISALDLRVLPSGPGCKCPTPRAWPSTLLMTPWK
jgi:hypothetical protein